MADEWDFGFDSVENILPDIGDDFSLEDFDPAFSSGLDSYAPEDGFSEDDYAPGVGDIAPADGETYSLDDILGEFGSGGAADTSPYAFAEPGSSYDEDDDTEPEEAPPALPRTVEEIADRSRRRAMETIGDTLRQYQNANAPAREETDEYQPQEEDDPAAMAVSQDATVKFAIARESEPAPGEDGFDDSLGNTMKYTISRDGNIPPEPAAEPESAQEPPKPRVTVGEDGVITLEYAQSTVSESGDDEALEGATMPFEPLPDRQTTASESYSFDDEDPFSEERESRPQPSPRRRFSETQEPPSFLERFFTPVIRLFALRSARRQIQTAEAENWPEPVKIRETPELLPRKAAKFYSRLIGGIRLRCRIATFLCLFLAWISLQLPRAGLLGQSVPLQAGVCMILTLAVMMAALDVVTTGLRQLFELHPGMESLATLAAIFSCADAAAILCGQGENLPFCAVGAVALAVALWSQRLTCSALVRTFKTAADSRAPSVLVSEKSETKGSKSLLSTPRSDVTGIVRRSEEESFSQLAYAKAAPIFIIAALVLSIITCFSGDAGDFLHTFSALLSVSASFAAFFAFPLPYALAARRLRTVGAAIAGYSGCADIGKTRRIVINDEDIFPAGTMRFSEINIQEGVSTRQVVSYTASLIDASGSGAVKLFDELMTRRGFLMPRVDEFKCHEGGGLSGMVEGYRVLVGSAGFMNLMGIRLPQNLQSKSIICTAIDNELVGIYVIEYSPLTSVQEALMALMNGRTQAIFAIRDFNITPLMIKKLFRLPTDRFNFPSFRDRYRIAAESARKDAPVDAVISRSGMLPLAEAAAAGRRLYSICRISTFLSLLGGGLGMAIMFLLCRTGSFDTATAGNVLSFMLVWALPELILSLGQNK